MVGWGWFGELRTGGLLNFPVELDPKIGWLMMAHGESWLVTLVVITHTIPIQLIEGSETLSAWRYTPPTPQVFGNAAPTDLPTWFLGRVGDDG